MGDEREQVASADGAADPYTTLKKITDIGGVYVVPNDIKTNMQSACNSIEGPHQTQSLSNGEFCTAVADAIEEYRAKGFDVSYGNVPEHRNCPTAFAQGFRRGYNNPDSKEAQAHVPQLNEAILPRILNKCFDTDEGRKTGRYNDFGKAAGVGLGAIAAEEDATGIRAPFPIPTLPPVEPLSKSEAASGR